RSHGLSGDEAVQRAMETAGRAVVFSGITVAIGLLALIALPLPFLRSMGYGGMLIPLVSTLVARTLLPVALAPAGATYGWSSRRGAPPAWTGSTGSTARSRRAARSGAVAVPTSSRRSRFPTAARARDMTRSAPSGIRLTRQAPTYGLAGVRPQTRTSSTRST